MLNNIVDIREFIKGKLKIVIRKYRQFGESNKPYFRVMEIYRKPMELATIRLYSEKQLKESVEFIKIIGFEEKKEERNLHALIEGKATVLNDSQLKEILEG